MTLSSILGLEFVPCHKPSRPGFEQHWTVDLSHGHDENTCGDPLYMDIDTIY